jgi:outer membrane protein OmpA-like peptidoglycan-associated protein
MQADMPVKISQNQLDGKIDLILYNPAVERVKTETLPEKNQGKIQISIPLDSALKLLRDKQNNVKLNIPISGDISHPEFSVADSINKVLVQSLQTSVLSYLKFTLGPYGIGLAVAERAISGSAKIHLNPILFAPGSDELDDAAIDYIQRVTTIMREYPEVQVSVCGVATESDREAVTGSPVAQAAAQSTAQTGNADAALLALAENRSGRVQNQLVNEHGIAAKRIIFCKPKIAKGADAKPRAELAL